MPDIEPHRVDSPTSIFSYYAAASHVLGIDRARLATEGVRAQAGFSLEWFFAHLVDTPGAIDGLNPITQAFLGVPAAADEMEGAGRLPLRDADLLESPFALNPRQRLAIDRALAEPVSLVQGPPGTGKTETILNMVSCIVAGGATVAVVSNNGEALNNIETKLNEEFLDLDEDEQGERPNWGRIARTYARLGSKSARKTWNQEHPDEAVFRVRRRGEEGDPFWNEEYATSGWEPAVRADEFLADHPFIASTIHSLKKTFADGGSYLYDYVIMDEASQCSVMLGLLTMSSARHLVLVGDTEQLAPVWNGDARIERELRERCEELGAGEPSSAAYSLQAAGTNDGTSILDAAAAVFGQLGAPTTMLNEHFRCHPGIIGFCNEQIYGRANPADPLIIKTAGYDRAVTCPIRVRWFEGNYCEAGADGASKRNLKQVEIFMREEWPALSERLAGDDGLSVCILSPFKAQLAELAARLAGEGVDAEVEDGAGTSDDPLAARKPESLTIHKAQGQQFDIVYLLPVEDGRWEWPWSQGRRLINVAVSRAKRELVVIASTRLMSPGLQMELTGHVLSTGSLEEHDEAGERSAEAQELYVQKLVDYTWRMTRDTPRLGSPQAAFGLHRSAIRSVFDDVPLEIDQLKSEEPSSSPESAPERLILEMLGHMDTGGLALTCVQGARIDHVWPHDLLEWNLLDDANSTAQNKLRFACGGGEGHEAHFDFVICKSRTGEVLLAIEVDGAGHRAVRNDGHRVEAAKRDTREKLEQRMWCQNTKDAIVRDMGGVVLEGNLRTEVEQAGDLAHAPFVLLRLPTDGITAFECERLRRGAPIEADWIAIEELIALRSTAPDLPTLGR